MSIHSFFLVKWLEPTAAAAAAAAAGMVAVLAAETGVLAVAVVHRIMEH